LTRNGKGYAAKGFPYFNIKPGKLDVYATFLVDVPEHFRKEGLGFDYLSPFNEPQWAWDDAGQEGTPALNTELYALIRYLSKELSQRKLATQLVIGEAGTIGHAFLSMESMGLKATARMLWRNSSSARSPRFTSAICPTSSSSFRRTVTNQSGRWTSRSNIGTCRRMPSRLRIPSWVTG
jgi:hypothetical protein